ncbi:unnamed protein product [Chilo suppressalis]|uniref:Uncharacterized protein n=1 Tax=Chilo suppressalis TaxID=168631 RepID=A0ABN8BGP9_CHISP|nr:unnamed protein product [Chilo suppressalis]
MKILVFVTLFLVIILICTDARKTSRSRSSGSGRGSSRKTSSNPQPVPTSFSNPQASAPKPSLFGWQEKPAARNTHTYPSKQSNPSSNQNHGYPSSQTGLSGNTPVKQPPSYQDSIQRSNVPQQNAHNPGTQSQSNHAYPASNGFSGSSGSAGYPQGSGLSGTGSGPAHTSGVGYPQSNGPVGTGVGYPHGSGISGAAGAPPPYPGYKSGAAGNYPAYSGSNNYHPPQGPPPPYSNHGSHYGGYSGYGGHGVMPNPQMPGYFGNYGNNYGKGFGGMSRPGSGISGLGLAGAGIGTVLTGLALWNLARSTGQHHHTVIYDNRGQPVAVAPANGTDPAVESILKDLVNCTLTISSDNSTEVLAIPCAIATSFTPDTDVKDANAAKNNSDNTKCTVTVVTKEGQEFMTTIPCSILLNTAAENNVTEPALVDSSSGNVNASTVTNDTQYLNQPSALKLSDESHEVNVTCSPKENGEIRDPINPCLAVTHNLTVVPLEPTTPTSLLTQNSN